MDKIIKTNDPEMTIDEAFFQLTKHLLEWLGTKSFNDHPEKEDIKEFLVAYKMAFDALAEKNVKPSSI